jgi:hypothetical protein
MPVVTATRSITRAIIYAFCNKVWQDSVNSTTSTLFDQALQMVLDDLSSKIEIIRAIDDTQSLAVEEYALAYPTGLMPGGLISITLTDAAGLSYEPLEPFSRGLRDYRALLQNNGSVGQPDSYIEAEDDQWYVWRPANQTFTVLIEYYRTHPQDLETILLPDSCMMAVKVGTAYFEAVLRRNSEYQATWGPHYAREFQAVQGMYPGQPRGVYP